MHGNRVWRVHRTWLASSLGSWPSGSWRLLDTCTLSGRVGVECSLWSCTVS